MKKAPGPPEHSGEKVPIWIISFADMITLLLSFFVMLQTMAHSRDAMLFGIAQDSFRRSIAGFGIPDLILGRKSSTSFDYRKLKYPVDDATPSEANVPPSRIIDSDDEDLRQKFLEMERIMETSSSDQQETVLQAVPTPIRFLPAGATLDDDARAYLANLANDLRQNLQDQAIKIYVIGATPTGGDKAQWFLAARRAAAVEQHLRGLLGETHGRQWELHSLGAPATSRWCQTPQATVQCPPVTINIVGRKN